MGLKAPSHGVGTRTAPVGPWLPLFFIVFLFWLSCFEISPHPPPRKPPLFEDHKLRCLPCMLSICVFLFLFPNCWASASVGPRGQGHSRGSQPCRGLILGKWALLRPSLHPSLSSCDELETGNCWGISYELDLIPNVSKGLCEGFF